LRSFEGDGMGETTASRQVERKLLLAAALCLLPGCDDGPRGRSDHDLPARPSPPEQEVVQEQYSPTEQQAQRRLQDLLAVRRGIEENLATWKLARISGPGFRSGAERAELARRIAEGCDKLARGAEAFLGEESAAAIPHATIQLRELIEVARETRRQLGDSGSAVAVEPVPPPGGESTSRTPTTAGSVDDMIRLAGGVVSRAGHRVSVAAFYLDVTEVPVRTYRECVEAGVCSAAAEAFFANITPEQREQNSRYCNARLAGRDDHPINCVDWSQAQAYCDWRGKRLPSLDEWYFAASSGGTARYPWGEDAPADQVCWSGLTDRLQGGQGTCPVRSGAPSPAGLFQLTGNVREWVVDCRGLSCDARYVAGGKWLSKLADEVSSSSWATVPTATRAHLTGFRCAKSL
jgi:formylglycine-generating enzyme required for sulfatase activity